MSIVRFQIFQNTGGDSPCSPISLAPIADTSKVVTAYSDTPTASGGTAPYTYTVTAGALPTGLSINASTGLISGTTSLTSATYNFTIQAEDINGCTGSQAYSIEVNEFYNYLEALQSEGGDATGDLPAAYKQLFIDLNTDRPSIARALAYVQDGFTGFNVPIINSLDGTTVLGNVVSTNNNFVGANWGLLTGLQGDGSTKYLDHGFNPSTIAEIGLNSAGLGVWNSVVNNGRFDIGCGDGTNSFVYSSAFAGYIGNSLCVVNGDTITTGFAAQTAGFSYIDRIASTENTLYKNGVAVGDQAETSTAKPNNNVHSFKDNGVGLFGQDWYSSNTHYLDIITTGLGADGALRVYNAFNTFFTTIGR